MKQCPMGWNWNETRAERGAEDKAFSLLAPEGMEKHGMEGKPDDVVQIDCSGFAVKQGDGMF